MNHRELFDAMTGFWLSDRMDPKRPPQGFIEWLNRTKDGRNVRAKIDLLDQFANGWPESGEKLPLIERLGVLEAEMVLYTAHVENLIERVYALEPDPQPVGITDVQFEDGYVTWHNHGNAGDISARSALVEVLQAHEGAKWKIGKDEWQWKCNCCWEGSNHAEHVANMYAMALEARHMS